MTITEFTADNLRYLQDQIAAGTYPSIEVAVNEIIEQSRANRGLMAAAEEGCRELDAGQGRRYDDRSLAHRFEELREVVRQRAASARGNS